MTYRIKAYTPKGLLISKPFYSERLALPMLFNVLAQGITVSKAFLSSPKGSKSIFTSPSTLTTRPTCYTRPDGTTDYGTISIRDIVAKHQNIMKK